MLSDGGASSTTTTDVVASRLEMVGWEQCITTSVDGVALREGFADDRSDISGSKTGSHSVAIGVWDARVSDRFCWHELEDCLGTE